LLAVLVVALTLSLSNAAWAQAVSLPDVGDNPFAASEFDVSILDDLQVCGTSPNILSVDVTGTAPAFGNGDFVTCIPIGGVIDD
jgi:hypothetical protein